MVQTVPISQSQTALKPVILQVLPRLESGGVERGVIEIADAIIAAGAEALVASEGGRMAHDLKRLGAHHITLPLASKNPFVMWQNVARLRKVIRDWDVNLVHVRSRAPAYSALAAAQKEDIPTISTFHGNYRHGSMLKRKYNSIMLKADRVIAVSEFIARHINDTYYQLETDRLRVIPRGVDLRVFQAEYVSAERVIALNQAWRLPDGCKVIMLPGRITHWKGHETLIDALAQIRRERPLENLRCVFVGHISAGRGERFLSHLKQKVDQLNLTDIVQFAGDCKDMAAAYKLSDIVVSASTQAEAFGRVIIEAQAMQCSVIASDCGGATETVIDGKTGWRYPPGDADALAAKIRTALDLGDEERQQMAETALKHVSDHYSAFQMCEETLKVYNELLIQS